MSGKAQGRVYEMHIKGNEQSVLLSMADGADHNGANMHLAFDLLAYKTGLSWRTCKRIIDNYVRRKWLVQTGSFRLGSGQSIPIYKFDYDAVVWKVPFEDWAAENGRHKKTRGDKLASHSAERKEVTNTTKRGDKLTEKRCHPGVTHTVNTFNTGSSAAAAEVKDDEKREIAEKLSLLGIEQPTLSRLTKTLAGVSMFDFRNTWERMRDERLAAQANDADAPKIKNWSGYAVSVFRDLAGVRK